MCDKPVILINLLKFKTGKHDALIALLKENTETLIRMRILLTLDEAISFVGTS